MRTLSEEHKNKLRKQPNCRPVVQMTITGRIIRSYYSVSEAARMSGISRTALTNALMKKSGLQYSGGYVWKYLSDISTT